MGRKKQEIEQQTEPALGEWHYVDEEGLPLMEGLYHVTIVSKNGSIRTRREPHIETDYFEVESAKKMKMEPNFRKSSNENIHLIAWCPFPQPAYIAKNKIKELTEKERK